MAAIQSAYPSLSLSGGTLTGNLSVGGTIATTGLNPITSGAGFVAQLGNLDIQNAGSGLKVKEGSNAKQGQAVLVAGTVTVANTSVTASSRIFLTHAVVGGTIGIPSIGTVTAGTSFVINSSNAADTSTINYEIFEPG